MCLLALPMAAAAVGEQILADSLEGGLTCRDVAPSTVVVDVRSSVVRPVFRLNGAPFGSVPAQSATFFLVPPEGEPVLLGTTFDPPPNGVRVVNGVYDVVYRWRAGDQMPRNLDARVLDNVLIAGDRDLVVDVPSALLRGNLTMNGAPFPQNGVNAATLSLVGVHALGSVALGSSNDSNFVVRLIPGAYTFRYRSNGIGGPIPANQDALRETYTIEPDTAALNFDTPAVLTLFGFTIGGASPPGTILENGRISLRTKDGDRINLGESRFQGLTQRVIPSTYDVYWEGLTGSAVAPANPDSRFLRNRAIGAGVESLNVPTVVVAGDFLVDGDPAPASPLENGQVWFRDLLTGAEVLLGNTSSGSFQRRVIPQSYDLVYESITGSGIVPANSRVIFEYGRSASAQPNADIDVAVDLVNWQLTLNGSAFPGAGTEVGRIRTRSADDLEDTLLGDTNFNTGGSRRLAPGDYFPIYGKLQGALVPDNNRAMLAQTFVAGPGGAGTQVIDVQAGDFGFTFRNNGSAFPIDPARNASVALVHREDTISLGTTSNPISARTLIANVLPLDDGRTATVHYTWLAGDLTQMPQNLDHPVACYVLLVP